jgi:hypothetical protein
MTTMKKPTPRVSAFAQMLRDKREKLAPDIPLRDFCAARGFDAPLIADMEADRRTAPGTYAGLYKLAGGYGHEPHDRWTKQLLDAALGIAPPRPKVAASARRTAVATSRARPQTGRRSTEPSRRPSAGRSKAGRDGGSRRRG